MAKDYSKLEKDELLKVVERLESRKKYGLIWEDKPEDVAIRCKTELPILKEVKKFEIKGNKADPQNLLIEGDNYHALSVLNFTHQSKIDLIYIDPPYNTGAKDWKYNNDYVDSEDPWRHSKWVSMMYKRLVLAKNLLKEDGSLICAIDDYELNTLGLLLDELYPAHEKNVIIVEHHPQGAGSNTVSRTHEYAYVLTPKGTGISGRKENGEESRWSLRRSGQGENNWRENRPNQFFAVLVDPESSKVTGVGPAIPKEKKNYPKSNTPEGYLRIYPLDKNGGERVWRYNRESMMKLIEEGVIEYTKKGALVVRKSGVAATPIFSVWKGSRYNAGTHGTNLLMQMLGKLKTFPYPKSLYTVLDMVEMIVKSKKNATVLDFFAGSGTTGHAVLELNKTDGGERSFILCTNNEGNICEDVTYERIKHVIKGYTSKNGEKIAALGGNLKFFRTGFIKKSPAKDELKIKLTNECTEMLCIREGIFDEI
ncbi:MAG: site-specific DNA-methyltransferase, partial [Candidatus Taylorbacteria bacterium]|nr:site-specific DNA-methyltransferase [Candidatus Taylorbacteria bacterium]